MVERALTAAAGAALVAPTLGTVALTGPPALARVRQAGESVAINEPRPSVGHTPPDGAAMEILVSIQ